MYVLVHNIRIHIRFLRGQKDIGKNKLLVQSLISDDEFKVRLKINWFV